MAAMSRQQMVEALEATSAGIEEVIHALHLEEGPLPADPPDSPGWFFQGELAKASEIIDRVGMLMAHLDKGG